MEALAQSFPSQHGRPLPFEAPAKYQLLRVIGSGGMGTVLLARDRSLGRLVALKFLRDGGPWFLERFRSEARRLARLAHPSIVAVHEFDSHAGRSYLAMDYIDGGSLAQARLEPRALVQTLVSVVEALGHAHRSGVVHRDIKPENVLLDRRGRAYLGDFGVAIECCDQSKFSPVGGTPLTMSPEQTRGVSVGARSDVFSFGVTLYRQLTAQWPFRGRTLADVLYSIQYETPRPLRAIEPGVPEALARIVLRCLEKDPEHRFQSMEELGRAFEGFLAGPSLFGRLRRRFAPRPTLSRGPLIHPEDLS